MFGVALTPRNRWGGSKSLRSCWLEHMEQTLLRPALLIDEAQEMNPSVLTELRLLSSTRFDSRVILSVVLAGDMRLDEKLRKDELTPLGSRLRARIVLDQLDAEGFKPPVGLTLRRFSKPNLRFFTNRQELGPRVPYAT